MSSDTERWCKIRRKTDLLFQKWHEFSEVWPKLSKFTKFSSFCAKNIKFDLKSTELSYMTLKGDKKFERKLTCGFHHSTWKSQNWDSDRILLSKTEDVQT